SSLLFSPPLRARSYRSIRQLDLHLIGDLLPVRHLGLVPCLRFFDRRAGKSPDHLLLERRRHLLGIERLHGRLAHDLEHVARCGGGCIQPPPPPPPLSHTTP